MRVLVVAAFVSNAMVLLITFAEYYEQDVLTVPRYRLADFCLCILIPIVLASMANQKAAFGFDPLDQLTAFHARLSSEC